MRLLDQTPTPPGRRRGWLTALAIALPLSCTGEYQPPPTSQGELGRGDFVYTCAGMSDALCPEGAAVATAFPQVIAVGGRFSLTYAFDSEHADEPQPLLTTSSPSRIAAGDTVFTALVPGYTAILAVSGTSQIIDVKHLRVDTIDHVALKADDILAGDAIYATVGIPVTITAEPRNDQDLVLAGSVDYLWAPVDDQLVQVVGAANDDKVVLQGLDVGETTISLTVGDRVFDVALIIEANAATTSDGSTSSTTDASTTDASTTDASTTDPSTTDASTTAATTGMMP